MKKKKNEFEAKYASRRARIIKQIKGEAAIFSSSPVQNQSRDLAFPYRQDSDFFYLTGFPESEAVLVLLGSSRGPRSILYLRDRNPDDERWTGERLGLKRAKKRFRLDEVRSIEQFGSDLATLLPDARALHYAAGSNPKIDRSVWDVFKSTVGPRPAMPHILKDARLITSQMRSVKDRDEIRSLRHAAHITAKSFVEFAQRIREVKSERHGAELLGSLFARYGGHGLAFPTIVAAGKNATTLHHEPQFHPLWQRELVLVDAGAMFNGYMGDVTRTFPVSGTFSRAQAAVYDIVLEASQQAIQASKAGNSLDDVHQAAVRVITKGLLDLRVLKGNIPQLINNFSYRKYFMHRTGHWLGLDVHDIAPIYVQDTLVPPALRPLEPGNVFTVEPGLYFEVNDSSVPAAYRGIGIRIEDNVLITAGGCEVLTSGMPNGRKEIEALMR